MEKERNWKRMMFKGNKVWLCVDDDQQPVVQNNKLLIKYQLDQDHEYWVRQDSVEPIDPRWLKKKVPKDNSHRHPSSIRDPEGSRDQPPLKSIVAYTDGASSGNPGPAGIGIVLRFGSHEKEISESIGIATNNVAELTAIRTALKAIRTTRIPVRLYTDSQYCYGLLSLGWKPKRNEGLVAAVRKLMRRFEDLKVLKIEGHAGIDDNERADRLAREGITGGQARKLPGP
jgi:ribonuclease HI